MFPFLRDFFPLTLKSFFFPICLWYITSLARSLMITWEVTDLSQPFGIWVQDFSDSWMTIPNIYPAV